MGLGDGLKGAIGGGMAGSALGPWGTVAGAGIGGLMGLFGGGDPNQQYRDQLEMMSKMQAPQMGPAAQGENSAFRTNQAALISQLEAQARGEGPSLAQQQLQAAQDRGMRQAQSMAAGARGPNSALAQFQAMQMTGQNQAQSAQDAAIARIQEQYNAQNLLGQNIQAGRGADEGMSQFNASARNQQMDANLQAKLAGMGYNLSALQAAGAMPKGVSLGDQIMAGGAGVASWKAQQAALNRMGQNKGSDTSGGGTADLGLQVSGAAQSNPWGLTPGHMLG